MQWLQILRADAAESTQTFINDWLNDLIKWYGKILQPSGRACAVEQ